MITCLKKNYFITNLPRFQKKGGKKKKKKSTLGTSRGHETEFSRKLFLGRHGNFWSNIARNVH
jgi:hypothetical protein